MADFLEALSSTRDSVNEQVEQKAWKKKCVRRPEQPYIWGLCDMKVKVKNAGLVGGTASCQHAHKMKAWIENQAVL